MTPSEIIHNLTTDQADSNSDLNQASIPPAASRLPELLMKTSPPTKPSEHLRKPALGARNTVSGLPQPRARPTSMIISRTKSILSPGSIDEHEQNPVSTRRPLEGASSPSLRGRSTHLSKPP